MQPSFFDQDRVLSKLDKLTDPLLKIDEIVNWEGFRLTLEAIRPQYDKQKGGRPPLDVVLMFKMIFLRHYYDLSLKQAEYQVLDRLSFRRFLGLQLEDSVPDTNTVWVYEERLVEANLIKPLFEDLMLQIENAGYLPRGGQIIDATIVEAPVRKKHPDDDDKGGKGGKGSKNASSDKAPLSPAQERQRNKDAHWTKKHGTSYFGFKDHINVDNKHKLIRCWEVTPANRYDGHLLNDLLDANNSSADVYADGAYRSAENEQKLSDREFRSQINRPKPKNKAMPKHIGHANQRKSKTRARVEHVCGGVKQGSTKHFIKCIGLPRATLRVGMKNMAYNIKRFSHLLTHVAPVHRTA